MIAKQLIIGSLVISGTVMIQTVFISSSIAVLSRLGEYIVRPPHQLKNIIVLLALVLWLVAGLSVSAWLWAAVYLRLDAFEALEPALYFSIVTFTTLGYGDVTLSTDWRIMGSLTAVNGLIVVGLNTAFLAEAIMRIRDVQHKNVPA